MRNSIPTIDNNPTAIAVHHGSIRARLAVESSRPLRYSSAKIATIDAGSLGSPVVEVIYRSGRIAFEHEHELKQTGRLGLPSLLQVHDPLDWTRQQKAEARNYRPGMVLTLTKRVGGLEPSRPFEIERVHAGRSISKGKPSLWILPSIRTEFRWPSLVRPNSLPAIPF